MGWRGWSEADRRTQRRSASGRKTYARAVEAAGACGTVVRHHASHSARLGYKALDADQIHLVRHHRQRRGMKVMQIGSRSIVVMMGRVIDRSGYSRVVACNPLAHHRHSRRRRLGLRSAPLSPRHQGVRACIPTQDHRIDAKVLPASLPPALAPPGEGRLNFDPRTSFEAFLDNFLISPSLSLTLIAQFMTFSGVSSIEGGCRSRARA